MRIYIPTMGRVLSQHTLKQILPEVAGHYSIFLVCPREEEERHAALGYPVLGCAEKGIAATRQWIMGVAGDDVVMLDDDLSFAVRRTDDPTKFRNPVNGELLSMFQQLEAQLMSSAHVGVSMREGANRDTEEWRECCRVARVIGYNHATFFREKVDFRHSTVMDDFEATLQLLTKGHPNAVLNTFVQNQRGSGTVGGASAYRTLAVHAQAAHTLAQRYPAFVRTVQKTTKTAWGGATRTDVTVQWKRAYEFGRKNRA